MHGAQLPTRIQIEGANHGANGYQAADAEAKRADFQRVGRRLFIEVMSGGAKAWRMRYRLLGKQEKKRWAITRLTPWPKPGSGGVIVRRWRRGGFHQWP